MMYLITGLYSFSLIVSIPGVLLISLALCADAAIGNYQEKALKQYMASNVEMVRESLLVVDEYSLIKWYTTQLLLKCKRCAQQAL